MGYIEDLRAAIGHRPVILTGSVVIICDEDGRILLQERSYPRGKWGLPGGLMELGESTEETARREALEETGLTLGRLTLINVYSGAHYLCKAANGDEWYCVMIGYYTREFTGTPTVSDGESLSLVWVPPERLPDYDIARTHRALLNDFLRRDGIII